jgi:winged helix DNA-binding protein
VLAVTLAALLLAGCGSVRGGSGATGNSGASAGSAAAGWGTYGPAGNQLVSVTVEGAGRVLAVAVQVPAGHDGCMRDLTGDLQELDATVAYLNVGYQSRLASFIGGCPTTRVMTVHRPADGRGLRSARLRRALAGAGRGLARRSSRVRRSVQPASGEYPLVLPGRAAWLADDHHHARRRMRRGADGRATVPGPAVRGPARPPPGTSVPQPAFRKVSDVSTLNSHVRVSRTQAIRYRLKVNNVSRRLPAGSYAEAAYAGLQDTAPRDALLGLHARVEDCEPAAWEHPGLIQTYSPRYAVYVLPRDDFGIFTVGRLPRDPAERQALEDRADLACAELAGLPQPARRLPGQAREVCATGRFEVRWTTSSLHIRERPRPSIDPEAARIELCRRHIHAFGPTTPATFAWWAGVSTREAVRSFDVVAPELMPVDYDGHQAWILAADRTTLLTAEPMRGVRFLVASDLRLFGQDRTQLFVGPGLRHHTPLHDTFHPNGLLIDGSIAGAWGRRAGRVSVRAAGPLPAGIRRAIRDEAESMPIPGAAVTMTLTEY